MGIEGYLQTVAQVSVALAGFAALISAFRRQDHPLTHVEVAGRNMILEMSLAAAIFALIPFPIEAVLQELGLIGVWRISSAGLLIFLILYEIYNYRIGIQQGRRTKFSTTGEWIFRVILLIINGFLALNIILWGTASVYMIGLVWMLIVAGTQFMIFVYLYSRQNDG